MRANSLSSQLEVFIETIRAYNIDLQNSGYAEKLRLELSSEILRKYQAQLDSQKSDYIKFYRSKSERQHYKKSLKVGNRKTIWFQNNGYAATLHIPNMPKSELLYMVKEKLKSIDLPNNYKVLVKEDNGFLIQHQVANSNNFLPSCPCGRIKCMLCQPDKTKETKCWKSNMTYNITCNPCLATGRLSQYRGESGRSGYS